MGGAKNYFGAKRQDCLSFDPSVLKVRADPQRPEEPAIDEAMVWSIMAHGVIEPLIISRDGDDVFVEAGRRRRAHAIEANRRRPGKESILVPCVWARGDEADLAEKAVIENFHRQSPSAIGTAKAMQHLINLGRDEERVRQVFGFKTINSVKGYLALLDCAPEVQRAVEGGLSAVVAVKLSKLTRVEQKEALTEMTAKGATKGAAAERAVKQKREGGEVEKPIRMRSRKFLEIWRREIVETMPADSDGMTVARVIDFILGNDLSLIADESLKAAAKRAEQPKKGRHAENKAESKVGLSQGRKAQEKTGTEEAKAEALTV